MIEETLKQKVLDRFIPEPMSGCWLWLGACATTRYGVINHQKKMYRAHRLSYKIHKGEIGDFHVLHKCDTPECVNPDHLFLGTHADNMRDRDSKKRQAFGSRQGCFTHPEKIVYGEKNHAAKLTENNVREIRRLYKLGSTQKTLACTYNVSQFSISAIVNYKTWKDVK